MFYGENGVLKSGLSGFITKRAAVFVLILSAADLAFGGSGKWMMLLGLMAGAAVGILRFYGNGWILKLILRQESRQNPVGSAVLFTAGQLAVFVFAFLAYCVGIRTLYGFVAGVLVIPLAVMMNSVTEAFGITKNNFE